MCDSAPRCPRGFARLAAAASSPRSWRNAHGETGAQRAALLTCRRRAAATHARRNRALDSAVPCGFPRLVLRRILRDLGAARALSEDASAAATVRESSRNRAKNALGDIFSLPRKVAPNGRGPASRRLPDGAAMSPRSRVGSEWRTLTRSLPGAVTRHGSRPETSGEGFEEGNSFR